MSTGGEMTFSAWGRTATGRCKWPGRVQQRSPFFGDADRLAIFSVVVLRMDWYKAESFFTLI